MKNNDVKLRVRKDLVKRPGEPPKLDAVDFVTQCGSTADITELQNLLQGALGRLKLLLANFTELELIKNYVKIVQRGLHHASRSMEAEQFYWYGHYVAQMQAVIDNSLRERKADALFTEITARASFGPIMRQLYELGVCQHKVLADMLHMNKSNLSKEMDKLVAVGLVSKIKGSKFVHYELTQQAYTFLNQYYAVNQVIHAPPKPMRKQYVPESSQQVGLTLRTKIEDREKHFDYSVYFRAQEDLRKQLPTRESEKDKMDEPLLLPNATKDFGDFEDLSFEKRDFERSATYVP